MAINNSGNVVQLQEHAGFTRKLSAASTARLLKDCTDTVLERTANTVARALDNVDDALFALADKADTNPLQGRYFDAMREIRIKRHEIEASFNKCFTQSAERLINDAKTAALKSNTFNNGEIGLSLVEDDDLEESLAINTLVDKLKAICRSELFAIDKRIGFLLDKDELDSECNPLSPKTICDAFKTACGTIESGVEVKIIVFKLFDRYICETIQVLYRDINNHLATNGVLPKIAARLNNWHQDQLKGDLNDGTAMSHAAGGGDPDFLTAFTQLMTANRPQLSAATGVGYTSTGSTNMLNNLTLLQRGQWEALGLQPIAIDANTLSNGSANILRAIKDDPMAKQFVSGDEIVIEVVALLFDYIFDNKGIPDRAKALIGRLQIPVLKVALLDKTFFSKRHHPARQLLNALAQSMIGLNAVSSEEDDLYNQLEACVQKVLTEFETDISTFGAALQALEAYLDEHQSHHDENIEEAKKVIQGRERLKIAESIAEDEIERKLEGKPFPEFIKTFAMDKWKNLLIVAYLKEGQDSNAWKSRLEILDLLIWSVLPKQALKEKKKLVDMLPTLLSGIETGMKLLSMTDTEQNEFIGKLADCHARSVNADAHVSNRPIAMPLQKEKMDGDSITIADQIRPAPSSAKQPIAKVGSMIIEEMAILGQSDGPSIDTEQKDTSEQFAVNINPFCAVSTIAQNVASNIQQDSADEHDAQREQTPVEDEYTGVVKTLVPGIWFEFQHEGNDKTMERLSWISAVLGTYLFTNHDGMKSREMTASELEESLRSGHAMLADDMNFLVDRSFNNLLDDLKKKAAG